jgi:hypothetical protein
MHLLIRFLELIILDIYGDLEIALGWSSICLVPSEEGMGMAIAIADPTTTQMGAWSQASLNLFQRFHYEDPTPRAEMMISLTVWQMGANRFCMITWSSIREIRSFANMSRILGSVTEVELKESN